MRRTGRNVRQHTNVPLFDKFVPATHIDLVASVVPACIRAPRRCACRQRKCTDSVFRGLWINTPIPYHHLARQCAGQHDIMTKARYVSVVLPCHVHRAKHGFWKVFASAVLMHRLRCFGGCLFRHLRCDCLFVVLLIHLPSRQRNGTSRALSRLGRGCTAF